MVEPFLPKYVAATKTNVTNRKQFCSEAITCLSKVSVVVGNELIPCIERDEFFRMFFALPSLSLSVVPFPHSHHPFFPFLLF